MSHAEPLQTSSIAIYPLSSSSSRQAMTVFTQLFSSCAGPSGKNHIVRNACGGHLTITSTCSRLLSSISFSRSELKLVVSAVAGHLQQCGDCGLFMIHMCLGLTKSVLDLDIHHSIASSTFQSFVSIIVDYLRFDNCTIRVNSNFSDINLLLSYIRSVLNSKVLLNVQPKELNSLSLIVLNAFVKAIPSVPSQRYSNGIFILGQEKLPISKCKCEDGLMIEFPELAFYGHPDKLIDKIKFKLCEDEESGTCLKVALITCSMSGDMDSVVNATLEGTRQQFTDLEDGVFKKMTVLCETLVGQSAALILCQKVIHPKLKALLRSKGIIYMDRLGSQVIPFIRDLTGCYPITSLLQNVEEQTNCLGKLTSVTACIENGQSYLCLRNSSANVVTLMLCAELEERLSELKHCVSASLKGLQSLAKEPWLLMGGGCWQMHCSQILKEKVLSELPEMCERLACPEHTLRRLLKVFQSCLHKWCLGLKHNMEHLSADFSSYHCWRVPKNSHALISDGEKKLCNCGFKTMPCDDVNNLDIVLIQDDDSSSNSLSEKGKDLSRSTVEDIDVYDKVVLDNFSACVEALHKGVLTAELLLSIGQFICDRN